MNPVHGNARMTGYAPVNGLEMYYEIEGTGDPLVHIPSAFGCAGMKSFPELVAGHSVITMDLQGHGRTADVPGRPLTLEQNAEDVVGLLRHLGISKADFFGESYGGAMAIMIALRHPELVGRIATYGATFGPSHDALDMEMLHTGAVPVPDSAAFRFQREHYRKVAPDPDYWARFWDKVCGIRWDGFPKDQLASLKAPVLIALGDRDFVRLEHAVETFRLIPEAELAVIPNAGHFALFSEPERVIPVIEDFLKAAGRDIPVANAETGYQPGKTR
ncbi:MAG TPA: alpha/beta hydrolase [Rhodanobacteraceae bacterium]|jgi:pimeloyl-ACP methyl ester carboxylesterase